MIKMSFKNLLLSVWTSMFLAAFIFAADPGSPIPTGATNDQQPGSVLVYNFYSSTAAPSEQDTRITLTNTSNSAGVQAHLFFVEGNVCNPLDIFVCLTPSQTTSFLASDVDPGVTGYIVAVASEGVNGVPIGFNFLIGSVHVNLASGHNAKLNAEGYQALFQGPLTPDNNLVVVNLDFDGVKYSKAARVLALDHIPSREDGNRTMLVVNSLSGNLATSAVAIGQLFGILFNDTEAPVSFTTAAKCQLNKVLSNDFPRTAPRFMEVIPSGRSGWLKLFLLQDRAISGAVINFASRSANGPNGFNGGSNLHRLTNTTGASTLTIPVFPPNC